MVIHPGPKTSLKTRGKPLFIAGGVGGNVNNLYTLAQNIGAARAVIGFQTRGVMGHRPHGTIEDMAAENIRYMRNHQATGPYLLAGYSGGAITAHEMVRQLEAAGEEVSCLVILDTYAPGFATDFIPNVKIGTWQRIKHETQQLHQEGLPLLVNRILAKLRNKIARGPFKWLVQTLSLSHYRYEQMREIWKTAARGYKGGPINAPVVLLKTQPQSKVDQLALAQDPSLGWSSATPTQWVEITQVDGTHLSMLNGENSKVVADHIVVALDTAEKT